MLVPDAIHVEAGMPVTVIDFGDGKPIYNWGEPKGPVELAREGVSIFGGGVLLLTVLGIGVALVVMGNTLARLIGIGLLFSWLYFALRIVVRRRAAADMQD